MTSEKRALSLLSIMTIDEKIAQLKCLYIQDVIDENGDLKNLDLISENGLGGFAFERVIMSHSIEKEAEIINTILKYIKNNTRLGIPPFIHAEALHGLCLKGATSFPQAIGLAAMWDSDMVENVSGAISEECKVRGINQVLSPTIDIARDLRWGRVEETYGEDVCLVSKTAVAFCKSFENNNVVTTLKHFVANSGDGGRDSGPVYHSERILKNLYFRPYQECIKEAGSRSVMASYNTLNSVPSGLNKWLLKDMLRDYLGFKGFVVTDYGLMNKAKNLHKVSDNYMEIAARAVKAGLNREVPSIFENNGYSTIGEALAKGLISEQEIDELVLDILRIKFDVGLFDVDISLKPKQTREKTNSEEHRNIAYQAAQKSLVLLKNNQALPFRKEERIALLGSIAKRPKLGGYSSWDIHVSSLADSLDNAEYVSAAIENKDYDNNVVVEKDYLFSLTDNGTESGITGFYKDNKEYCFAPILKRNDGNIDFDWSNCNIAEIDSLKMGNEFAVEWRGVIEVPQSGQYVFTIEANGGIKLEIDSEILIDRFIDTVTDSQTACYNMESGKKYPIVVGFSTSGTNPRIKLCWNFNKDKTLEQIDYNKLLEKYDAVVIAAGVTEGEGSDRAKLDLTGSMEKLICDVKKTGKKVIVVICAGSAVTMGSWYDSADAIIHAWYPGQEGGRAISDILHGRYSPAGRLPITFPQHVAQLPMSYNSEPRGRNSGYNDMPDKPLFEFGYGLSYTTFSYSRISLDNKSHKKDVNVLVSIDISNTGNYDGDEVVQLYINDIYSSVATPQIELKDFKRVHIKKGETKTVEFLIMPKQLQLLDENLNFVVEPGDFEIMIGSSCRSIKAKAMLRVE